MRARGRLHTGRPAAESLLVKLMQELSLACCALGPRCPERCVRLLQVSIGLALGRRGGSKLRLDVRVAEKKDAFAPSRRAFASVRTKMRGMAASSLHPSHAHKPARLRDQGRAGAPVSLDPRLAARRGQLCRERGAGAKTMSTDVRREAVSCED